MHSLRRRRVGGKNFNLFSKKNCDRLNEFVTRYVFTAGVCDLTGEKKNRIRDDYVVMVDSYLYSVSRFVSVDTRKIDCREVDTCS